MSAKSERAEREARDVAAWLDKEGHHAEAEKVRGVCRTAASLRETSKRLHSDNTALRAAAPGGGIASRLDISGGPTLTDDQRKLARHALGLPNSRCTSFRNRFITVGATVTGRVWEEMVAEGLATKYPFGATGDHLYKLTLAAARAALTEGEALDMEDFTPADAAPEAEAA